jgi:hypothetical protein
MHGAHSGEHDSHSSGGICFPGSSKRFAFANPRTNRPLPASRGEGSYGTLVITITLPPEL